MEDDYGSDKEKSDYEDEDLEGEQIDYQGSSGESEAEQSDENNDKDSNKDSGEQSIEEEEEYNQYLVLDEEKAPQRPNLERITSPFLTKYEKARVIGVRATQISKNSPLYLNADQSSILNWDPLTIAERELAEQKIPFIIRRYLPDGSYEDWKLSELKTFD